VWLQLLIDASPMVADIGTDNRFVDAFQHRATAYLAGDLWGIKQMEPHHVVCHIGILVLLMTVWMAFHPDLKGFRESLTAAQAEG
jgi:hypothetical protein